MDYWRAVRQLGVDMPFLSHSLSPLDSIPVGARADMGRQEADYVWKKTTENIQDVFEFVEELGS